MTCPATDPLLDALVDIVGAAHVLVDAELRAGYETDWTGRFHGAARAVVRPADGAQVAAVLARVRRSRRPGRPPGRQHRAGRRQRAPRRRGRAQPPATAATSRSTRTRARRSSAPARSSRTCSTRPARAGWELGVDLSSRGSCTIGGMVATNAGGEHVLRYGPMPDQLIGVEAALADGSRRRSGARAAQGQHRLPLGRAARRERGHARRDHPGAPAPRAPPPRTGSSCSWRSTTSARRCASAPGCAATLDSLVALEVCFADGIELVRTHLGLPAPFTPPAPVVSARRVRATRRGHGRARRAARRDRRRGPGGAGVGGRHRRAAPAARFWSTAKATRRRSTPRGSRTSSTSRCRSTGSWSSSRRSAPGSRRSHPGRA